MMRVLSAFTLYDHCVGSVSYDGGVRQQVCRDQVLQRRYESALGA